MLVKIATINILNDLSLWPQRKELLRDGLVQAQADLICMQEVRLKEDNAGWLAQELGYSSTVCPKAGRSGRSEGIAILSRLPVASKHHFDLGSQDRVVQAFVLAGEAGEFVLANGHFFWQPGESRARLRQVERLQGWLAGLAGERPVVVCGDFNGTPETAAILRMRRIFRSAYAAVHGHEPEYTCPTPLPVPKISYLKAFFRFFFVLWPWQLQRGWHGTLDYIFVSPAWRVRDCRLILNHPAPENPRLYPSDHFGLLAELEL